MWRKGEHLDTPRAKRSRSRSPGIGKGRSGRRGSGSAASSSSGQAAAAAAAAAAALHVPLVGGGIDFGDIPETFDPSVWHGMVRGDDDEGECADEGNLTSTVAPTRPIGLDDITASATHTGFDERVNEVDDVLMISQQPAAHGRFRYSKEGRKTPLPGSSDGGFPTVQLTPAYRHLVPDGTMVSVSLITKYHDDHGNPVRHWHTLEVKEGGAASRPLTMGSVQFPNLVVTRAAMPTDPDESGAARNPEDQHVIRLMFTMVFRDPTGALFKTRVISDPIYGIELKIHKSSHPRVPVTGQLDVFFLTSKVKKKNTLIRVREVYPAPFDPGPNSGWELDDRGRLTFTVDNLHVHYQYAVVATVPPYWDQTITTSRVLDVCLVDTAQELESNCVQIEYCPVQAAGGAGAAAGSAGPAAGSSTLL